MCFFQALPDLPELPPEPKKIEDGSQWPPWVNFFRLWIEQSIVQLGFCQDARNLRYYNTILAWNSENSFLVCFRTCLQFQVQCDDATFKNIPTCFKAAETQKFLPSDLYPSLHLVCDYDEMRCNPCFGVAVGIVFARFLCTLLLVVDLFSRQQADMFNPFCFCLFTTKNQQHFKRCMVLNQVLKKF